MAGPGTRYWLSLCQSDTQGVETGVEVGGNRRGFGDALSQKHCSFSSHPPGCARAHTHLQHKHRLPGSAAVNAAVEGEQESPP